MANKDVEILIHHGKEIQSPPLEGDITWETERKGSPAKLTVSIPKTTGLNFQEGEIIQFKVKNKLIFTGVVFTKSRNRDGLIKVTAYDYLRYFKNKHTGVYEDKTADAILKGLLDKYELPYTSDGIEGTSYVISSLTEDDQTLFDIVQDALDLTLTSTKNLYTLFCDPNGNVCLKNTANLKTNIIITDTTAENFDYSSSIDENTYNKIYLYYDNDETNKREEYISQDSSNIKKWGLLKYTESISTNVNASDKANKLLSLYNQKTRKLKVSGAFGDVSCKAGASVIVKLGLGDIDVSNYMLIEKATHKFTHGEHTMDLTLSGIKEFVS